METPYPIHADVFSKWNPIHYNEKQFFDILPTQDDKYDVMEWHKTLELLDLPHETMFYILSFLDGKDLCTLSITCKRLHIVAQENSLWRIIVDKRWTIRTNARKNWKKYYIEKHTMDKQGSLSWVPSSEYPKMKKIDKRHCHTASNTSREGPIAIIGGQDGTIRFNEVYYYYPKNRTFALQNCKGKWDPIARHTAVSDGKNVYIVGGFDGVQKFHSFSVFNVETCTFYQPLTIGTGPAGRSNAASALVGRKLYFHGGSAPMTNLQTDREVYKTFGDFYCLDLDTMTWNCLDPVIRGTIPSPRSGHKMITFGTQIYLFGGGVWDGVWFEKYSDLYIFDTETLTWTKPRVHGILPNTSTFSIPFRLGSQLFIFAGAEAKKDRNMVHNFTFVFDTVTMTWSEPKIVGTPPSSRDMGSANVWGDKVVFFGGYSGRAVDTYDELKVNFIPSNED